MATTYAEYYGAVFPTEPQVQIGVLYGPLGTDLTGTLEGGEPSTVPSVSDVRLGVVYGEGDALTGNLELPAESDVVFGIGYGAMGTEFTGSYAGMMIDIPIVTDVRDGVSYGLSGSMVTGVLGSPEEADVLYNVGYGAYDSEFVGSLHTSGGSEPILVEPPVNSYGGIRSPLIIGNSYLTQNGMGFVWRVLLPDGYTPATMTATFRGRAVQTGCPPAGCPDTYEWSVEHLSITPVIENGETYHDIAFDMPTSITGLIAAGFYDWWVVIEEGDAQNTTETGTGLQWVCG